MDVDIEFISPEGEKVYPHLTDLVRKTARGELEIGVHALGDWLSKLNEEHFTTLLRKAQSFLREQEREAVATEILGMTLHIWRLETGENRIEAAVEELMDRQLIFCHYLFLEKMQRAGWIETRMHFRLMEQSLAVHITPEGLKIGASLEALLLHCRS